MKWSGFDEDAATWEPSQNVPKFVQAYYKKDSTRLGRNIPNPVIKHSKKVANTKLGKRTGMYIDKFHFKNHIGKECVQKRDPYKIE